MNKKSGSGSGLFLMEMIVVVFFFIICASFCIMIFVKANNMSRMAKDTNQSVLFAESIAEVWKAKGDEGLTEVLKALDEGNGYYRVFRDENWEQADQEHAAYAARVHLTEADSIEDAEITVEKGGTEIYQLQVSRYQP